MTRSRAGRGAVQRLVLGLLVLVVTALALGCSRDAETAGEPPESDAPVPAPGFALERLDGGEPVDLADLRGKTVVLDFWATWCPPCEFQVPELNRFFDAHRGDSDVAVFGISVDTEGRDVVQAWVTEKGVRYPVLLGGEDLARRYGAVGFPTLYVIGPDGLLRGQHVGLIETATLEAELTRDRDPDAS